MVCRIFLKDNGYVEYVTLRRGILRNVYSVPMKEVP